MKKLKDNKNKITKEGGITLIALVVVIIVLIILAGVTISMLSGETGILSQATKAKQEDEKARIIEEIKLEIMAKQIDNCGTISNIQVKKILNKYGKIDNDILNTDKGNYKIKISNIWTKYDINNQYEGAKVSILGDSISTLKGYIPTENRARYVQKENEAINGLIYMNYKDTWWGGLIEDLGMSLGINQSWAGSKVSNINAINSGDDGPDRCMASYKRITALGDNGIPDVIFFFGGTNDIGNSVDIGSFNSEVEFDSSITTYSCFADAYTVTLKRLINLYPDTEIIVILPTYTKTYYTDEKLNQYNNMIIEICEYFKIKYIDLRECGLSRNNLSVNYADGIHPNVAGMEKIKKYIKNSMSIYESGLNVSEHMQMLPTEYSSTTNLLTRLNLVNEYYDGSDWSPIAPNGKNVYSITVPVVKGEKIFTNELYHGIRVTYFNDNDVTKSLSPDEVANETLNNGYLTVPENVTSVNIPFWSESATENFFYLIKNITLDSQNRNTSNMYAQNLPENLYFPLNLYSNLSTVNKYYNSNGDFVDYNNVVSIIIPVNPGDHILANSFGNNEKNGGGNGIRTTYLYDNDIISSLSTSSVYEEYTSKGFLTVPENVNAMCISWWCESSENFALIY